MASGSPNPPAYSAKIKNFNGGYFIRNKLYSMALIIILCSVFYFIGVWVHSSTSDITTNWTSTIADNPINCSSSRTKTITTHVSESPNLDFTSHHTAEDTIPMSTTVSVAVSKAKYYPPCDVKYSEYTPCEDTDRSLKFDRERSIYRERHCPEKGELLKCRIPAPFGYRIPFRWPKSRDFAWYANVPHKHLTMAKARQNWVRSEGDRFRFPGGGTTFPKGAGAYIDDIGKLINLRDGSIRTAIDTGCGVASWGAYLLSRNILTMSFAPKDSHEAQVQFAIERGVPALLGILASIRLPYPSRAFDMAHCSRCLIPWAQNDGQYLIEVDRVLRPGGYWVLSGPPINFKKHRKGWKRTREDLSSEQLELEAVAKSLCWRKLVEKADIAIWQKPINHIQCKTNGEIIQKPPICQANDPDKAWYTKMATCLTPLPNVSEANDFAGGKLTKWPERLTAIPPRISSGSIEGYTEKTFKEDTHLWEKRVGYYKNVNNELRDKGRYRNLLDMNAHLGGFAAALVNYPLWVMNVVPTESKINTLGVIYERGLIGTYQNWCEAMSTYPRSYDLLHADSVFSLYKDRCEMEDILLEMDRILRPEGTAIIRDDIDILLKIKSITDGLQWNSRIVDHEDSPHNREKLLFVTKMYWTAPDRREANPAS